MRKTRLALGATVVSGLGLCALGTGYGSASTAGGWIVTDLAAQARRAFPGYTGIALVGMTAGGRVLWTAQAVSGSQWNREVFQWQNGTISDLGQLPQHMLPNGWNSGGAVVGASEDPPYCAPYGPAPGCKPGPSHAYLWQPGKPTPLGGLGGASSRAWAINDRGQIVGSSDTANDTTHAVLWQNGKIIDLSPPGTQLGGATAINDHGQILEEAFFKKTEASFLWQRGKTTRIGAPGAEYLTWALNERGQVIGDWRKPTWKVDHAFLWQKGKTTDLGPTAYYGYPMAINDRGQVIEPRQTRPDATHAALWQDGKLIDLGSLGGPRTYPLAINNRGQVVGVSSLRGSTDEVPTLRAFLWQNGKMTELPTPVLEPDPPMAIDGTGMHVVLGTTLFACLGPDDCGGHLFLWTYQR